MPLAIHRSKVAIALCLVILAALLAVVLTSSGGQVRAQSGLLPPPLPMLIGGTVTIGGNEAPDGISIVSRMDAIDGDKYQSGASITSGGKYKNLKVAPPDIKYQSRQVTFHVIAVEGSATSHLDEEGLTARESFFFGAGAQIQDNFDLTFPAIPPSAGEHADAHAGAGRHAGARGHAGAGGHADAGAGGHADAGADEHAGADVDADADGHADADADGHAAADGDDGAADADAVRGDGDADGGAGSDGDAGDGAGDVRAGLAA